MAPNQLIQLQASNWKKISLLKNSVISTKYAPNIFTSEIRNSKYYVTKLANTQYRQGRTNGTLEINYSN